MTLEEFIKNTVIDEIGLMVSTKKLKYLSFFVMSSAIEFLGACIDNKDFYYSSPSRSSLRFKKAIDEIHAFSKYRGFVGPESRINLYPELRCGLIHAALPKSMLELTEQADTVCGKMHMQEVALDNRTTPKRLILVCEELYADVRLAAVEVIGRLKLGNDYHKANEPFLVTDIKIAGTP